MTCHYPNLGSRFVLVEANIPRGGTTNQKHYPDLGSVVASPIVSCCLRLAKASFTEKNFPVKEGHPPPPAPPSRVKFNEKLYV